MRPDRDLDTGVVVDLEVVGVFRVALDTGVFLDATGVASSSLLRPDLDLDTGVVVGVFKVALDTGVFLAATGVSSSFMLDVALVEAAFFLTVGGVACSLAAAVLLERELRLERGVGEDTTELRDERVERLEEGIGELEEERMEVTSLALVAFFTGTVFFF